MFSKLVSRVAILATPVALSLVAGCAVATSEEGAATNGANVGETSQALSGYSIYSWGTTNDIDGYDTGLSSSSWTCMLRGVAGDLAEGEHYSNAARSRAGAGTWGLDTSWRVFGHGGATEDSNGNRVWLGNPVNAGITCIPYARVATATWTSIDEGVAAPVRITDLGDARRQCFLTNMRGGHGLWNGAQYARVVKMDTIDATHPTTGWYVESNEQTSNGVMAASLTASCVDFPTGTAFQASIGQPSGATPSITTLGSVLNGVKACALAEVRGPFTQNSWSDGVWINAPTASNSNWTMSVHPGKYGRAVCAL